MLITALIVVGWIAAIVLVAVAHDAVCRHRHVAELRTWAFEHCVSLAGMTRREVRQMALLYADLRADGYDMAEIGRELAMQQQIAGILWRFGRTPEGQRVARDLRADLARRKAAAS